MVERTQIAVVRIAPTALDAILHEARAVAPREACGILAGTLDRDRCLIHEFVPMANVATSEDEWSIDPVAFARAEAALRASGLSCIGFAHSHPRGPARPSHADRTHSWPGFVCMIAVGPAAGPPVVAFVSGPTGGRPLPVEYCVA